MLNYLKVLDPRSSPISRWLSSAAGTRFVWQAGIVLATLALAFFLGQQPSLWYILAPAALVGAWIMYARPELGVALLPAIALLIPFEIGTSTGSPLNAAFLAVPALASQWLLEMAHNRSVRLVPSSTTLPLVGFIATASLSLLVGYLPWNIFAQLAPLRAELGAWGIMVFSVLAFWLTANRIRSVVWLRRMVWVFLGVGSFYILGRLLGPAAGSLLELFTFGSYGSLYWIWLVVLASGQALFNRDLASHWRFALGILVVATFVVALTGDAQSWTSGWLPALVGLALLVWLRWPRGALLLGVLAAIMVLFELKAIQYLLIGENQYSILTRGAALTIVLEIFKANPLLGVGPANYYYYTPLYPILGYYVRFNSHNNYVDILAQTGLVGMFFFAWFVLATGRVGWRLRQKFDDGFRRGYVNSVLAGLVGCLVAAALGDWLLPFVYNIDINGFRASVLGWLFMGGLVALEQMARAAAPAQPAPGAVPASTTQPGDKAQAA
jgi:O-antigen ligase